MQQVKGRGTKPGRDNTSENPVSLPISLRLAWLTLHEDIPDALHNRLIVLVAHVEREEYRTAAQSGHCFLSRYFHDNVNGVPDEDRLAEFPVFYLAEGEHRPLDDASSRGKAGGDGNYQEAVGDTLTEGGIFYILSIGVN